MAFKKGYIPTLEHRENLSKSIRANMAKLGYRNSPETREKIRITITKLGMKPPSTKGSKLSEEHKEKIRQWCKNHPDKIAYWRGKKRENESFEKHYNWKGDNVGYKALHTWVKRVLGQPLTCEHCGKTGLTGKQIHWANKSREYKRIKTDWLRLCVSCHKEYDQILV